MGQNELFILGVMAGSSLDGVDFALCNFAFNDQNELIRWSIEDTFFKRFHSALKDTLERMRSLDQVRLDELENEIALFVSNAIEEKKYRTVIDAIGYHGITLFHDVQNQKSKQLGNEQLIAQRIGYKIISDFRNKDLSLGGVGTPLAVLADKHLFPGYIGYVNIGGITNVTILNELPLAYDICPSNQVLNKLSNELGLDYDHNGFNARKGAFSVDLNTSLQKWSYYNMTPPKAIDNAEIWDEFFPMIDAIDISIIDKLNTFTRHIANKIIISLEGLEGNVLVTGGGAKNLFLIDCIIDNIKEQKLKLNVVIPDEGIIDYKEASLMALMAAFRLKNIPNVLSEFTGAKDDSISGEIFFP